MKKVFVMLFAIAMVMLLLTATAYADDSIAQIGSAVYDSLADAVAAAQEGDTITLLADNAENFVLPAGVTFDTTGKAYSGTVSAPEGYLLNNTEGVYTVAVIVARIGQSDCASLADAVAAAQNGETITLLTDSGESFTLPTGVTFNTNGKSYSGEISAPEGYVVKSTNGVYTAAVIVARIGERGYASLVDAVAAAQNGETITLLTDSGESFTLPAGVTFNKNGKSYSGTISAPDGCIVKETEDTVSIVILSVTVADGTATESHIPVYGFYNDAYNHNQMIYLGSMLEDLAGKKIGQLTFYSSNKSASWGNASFKVYAQNTEKNDLSAGYEDTENAQLVYEGPLSVADYKMVVPLDSCIEYNGGNLLLTFDTVRKGSYQSCNFYGIKTGNQTSRQANDYDYIPTSGGTPIDFLPKVTFDICNNITAEPLTNGALSVPASAISGKTVTVIGTMPEGTADGIYRLDSVDVTYEGGSVTAEKTGENTFIFTMPEADVTVSGTVTRYDAYSVQAETSGHGTVSADHSYYAEGDTVTLTVNPQKTYRLKNLTVTDADGGSVAITNDTFSMPAKNITVTAEFEEDPLYGSDNIITKDLIENPPANVTVQNVTWDDENQCAVFSGNNSYLSVPSVLEVLDTKKGFMVSAEVMIDSDNANWARIFDYNNGTTNKYFTSTAKSGDDAATLRTMIKDSSVSSSETQLNISNPEDYRDTWVKLIWTVMDDGSMRLYHDAISNENLIARCDGTAASRAFLADHASYTTCLIGASAFGNVDGYFKGMIKSYSVTKLHSTEGEFDREISTAEELQTLLAEGGGGYLTQDITLTDTLTVPAGKTVNLCLHGHILAVKNGNIVIEVLNGAKLNLSDCEQRTTDAEEQTITAESLMNGTLSVPASALPGQTVTVIGVMQEGTADGVYCLDSVNVTYEGGFVFVTKTDVNTFTFIMPDADVTVSGTATEHVAYAITLSDCANGTLTANHSYAAAGQTVTVTVEPENDYDIIASTLKAVYSNGAEDQTIILTQDADDPMKYTFTMPAYAVTVTAEFGEFFWKDYYSGVYADELDFSIGTGGGPLYWGIRIPPASMQSQYYVLTKIRLFETNEWSGTYQLYLVTSDADDTDARPSMQSVVYQQTLTVNGDGWDTYYLTTPFVLDGTKDLWIILHTDGIGYPMSGCSSGDTIIPDGAWLSMDGDQWNIAYDFGFNSIWLLSGGFQSIQTVTVPTAAENLIYSSSELIGVEEGEGYILSGTASAVNAGSYTATATLKGNCIWSDGSTEAKEIPWNISRADQTAPAAGEGYTVDYEKETMTTEQGYELRASVGKFVTGTKPVRFGSTFSIRKAADANHNASGETPFTFTRPEAPVESDFTVAEETIENKKDGSFGGITKEMEYKKDNGEWTSGPDTLTGLTNETIKVRYKATDTAFKSEECTVVFTASTVKLIVTMGETSEQVAYNAFVTKPENPEKSGYTFGGWYSDEECTKAWNFGLDTVKDNMTLYPKWISNSVPTAVVSGTVKEGDKDISNAKVELFLGVDKVASVVTNPDGSFSFDSVENGVYNIVVTTPDGSNTKTKLITVNTQGSFTVAIDLSSKAVNSVVEFTGTADENAKVDISRIVVGGLDTVAEAESPAVGDMITIRLTVEALDGTQEDAEEIKTEAGNGKKVECFGLQMKKVSGTSNDPITDTNPNLLEIVIPFDFTNVDVNSITVMRKHGTNPVDTLTTTPNANGEYIAVDMEAGTVTIYARLFSTYAVVYQTYNNYPNTYAVIGEDTENGKLTIGSNRDVVGSIISIRVTPDEGYELGTLTVKDVEGNAVMLTQMSDTVYYFCMPASDVTVSAVFEKIPCPQDETCVYAKFTDSDTTAWYHDGVHFCVENGYMKGISDTQFAPAGTNTRAMIVTILWRMEGEPIVNYAMSFADVPADEWYTEAIRWAQSADVVKGYSAETFGPNDPITREQMATILYRFAKNHGIDVTNTNTLEGFTDADKVSAWALDALKWANAAGLVLGRTTTTLVPEVSITRAEAAAMVQRYCEKFRED